LLKQRKPACRTQKLLERKRKDLQILNAAHRETEFTQYKLDQRASCDHVQLWHLLVKVSKRFECRRGLLNFIKEHKRLSRHDLQIAQRTELLHNLTRSTKRAFEHARIFGVRFKVDLQ
jgi:hypothetical protein